MLEPFVDPLPSTEPIHPISTYNGMPFYHVSMRQCRQKLHRDLPPTTIWGYNGLYPGPTFRVSRYEPIIVLWTNELPCQHILPIDTTVHGAEEDKPEVRTVVHLHGGVTPDLSDGYPEAWFTNNFEIVGPYFRTKLYEYPNQQPATTLWYHDHAMGITRLNIYAGLAGFYIIHDQEEQLLPLPKGSYDIPLLIQDRSFDSSGALFYPSQPDPPIPSINPSVVPDFFGKVNLVNGKIWPYLNVEPRRYRFRILNGANARFYRLSLSNAQPFYQVGTDQGLLPYTVKVDKLLLAPAERADIIIDFSHEAGNEIVMRNDAMSPFPQGDPPDPTSDGLVMKFRVNKPLSNLDESHIPKKLSYVPKLVPKPFYTERKLLLNTRPDSVKRNIHLLDDRFWSEPITENPSLWTTEIWSFINMTGATHPIHLHLVRFQILDRQSFDQDVYEKNGKVVTTGPKIRPETNEAGWKDTVRANPAEITRIIMVFGPYTGLYVWHCHILEHEDYEMMRPYIVIR
ncbi:multicopper oxidase [Bacillus spongiae]|uniref:Multicopper oxidase n=1 Tax=Bacillus spongiae TaxID=2683610 RepID=A0ABU8HE11_9BACI